MLQTLSDDRRCRLHLELAIAQQRSGRPATDTIAHLLGAGPLVEASTLAACAQEAGETLVRRGDARTAARIIRDVLANSLPPSIEVSAKRVLGVALLALWTRRPTRS